MGAEIYLSEKYERNRCFLLALDHLTLRKPNLQVANKRVFHQPVKLM